VLYASDILGLADATSGAGTSCSRTSANSTSDDDCYNSRGTSRLHYAICTLLKLSFKPAPVDAPATADSASSTSAQLDDEAEKRKKRAERFGIPFVENPVVSETKRGRKGKGAAAGADKPAEVCHNQQTCISH
jgi:hypothetical protein